MNLHTWTGWGGVSHWNAFVANLEDARTGQRSSTTRLDDATRFPIAAREGFGHRARAEDLITPLLPALQLYQLALPAPAAPRGSFDRAAAKRGEGVFNGKANCGRCHVPPLYHRARLEHAHRRRDRHRRFPGEPRAGRALPHHSAARVYGRMPRAASTTTAVSRRSAAVIDHYDAHLSLASDRQARNSDLAEYLKSL